MLPAWRMHTIHTLISSPGSVIFGGCGYLKLADRILAPPIDFSKLSLYNSTETAATIEIEAMTSLRTLETLIWFMRG